MKRILSLILVAVLCIGVLTGCQVVDKVKDLIGLGQPDVTTEGPTVDDAMIVLHNIMKEKNTSPKADFDLVAQVIAAKGDVKATFTVEWTCDDETIVIRESTKKGFVTVDLPETNSTEFNYVLTATVKDAEGNKTSKSYTYTLPVINNVGITNAPVEGAAYKIFMNQVNYSQKLYLTGEENGNYLGTTNDPKKAADFYVEAADDGLKFYTLKGDVKTYILAKSEKNESTGKYVKSCGYSTEDASVFKYASETNVWVTTIGGVPYALGTYGSHETISISESSYYTPDNTGVEQFPAEFMDKAYAETLTPDERPASGDPEANSTLTIKEAIALGKTKSKDMYTEGKYYVTGVIDEIYNDQYGNMYIKDAEGNRLCVYGTYDASGDKRFDAMATKPAVGDTITVYGIIGMYNEPQMKNGWITAINGEGNQGGNEGGNTDTPSVELGIVTNPEVGTAYKFGLYHGNEKATVYFTGNNYTSNKGQTYAWYLEYSKNIADAVDVYLEAVDGGYRLYFMKNDVKTYIVTYQDSRENYEDVGTIKLDTNAPAEFYTFNTEYNTLVWTNAIDKVTYLGSSGTYTSISASKIDYISNATSYVAHLYAEGATGEEAPHTHEFVNGKCACGEVDPNYVAPDMPTDGVYTIPQVLAAAEGTKIVVTGTVESFYYDWDDNYGNCSVYIVDEAGNKLLCFRLKTKVAVGDNITVTGTVAVYNGKNQIGEGCTAVINQGGNEGGNTGNEGENQNPGTTEGNSTSVVIADYAAANNWANSTGYTSFELNDVLSVSVTATPVGNYGQNTGKYYTSNQSWRVYQNEKPTVTISAEGKTIASIKFTFTGANNGVIVIDGVQYKSGDVITVNASSFNFSVTQHTATDKANGNVQITAIEVVYA